MTDVPSMVLPDEFENELLTYAKISIDDKKQVKYIEARREERKQANAAIKEAGERLKAAKDAETALAGNRRDFDERVAKFEREQAATQAKLSQQSVALDNRKRDLDGYKSGLDKVKADLDRRVEAIDAREAEVSEAYVAAESLMTKAKAEWEKLEADRAEFEARQKRLEAALKG